MLREMPASQRVAKGAPESVLQVLGVDTCGPTGSVALGRIESQKAEILGQKELAGRTYSATLVSSVGELLKEAGTWLDKIDAIVVVNGPGSFTGVRVGLSAVKGLAEPEQIPVIAVSRLAVMEAKAGVGGAALDAHRQEVFLRVPGAEGGAWELLAGAEELAAIPDPAGPIAVCDEAAESVLKLAWPKANLVKTGAPTAADAIEVCVSRILAGDFADLALLDGHYLRRSDAEIFGKTLKNAAKAGGGVYVRRMRGADIDRVIEIAAGAPQAPAWPRSVYEKALEAGAQPRRIAVVAEEQKSGALVGFVIASVMAPEAELETIVTALAHQRRGVARELFSSLKSELRHEGVNELILEVRSANHAALGLYRVLGFKEEGRRKAYYADPVDDAVLLRTRIG
jgi:tRNA threonylcarbamoyladenosine biosynthesis protein TsaB